MGILSVFKTKKFNSKEFNGSLTINNGNGSKTTVEVRGTIRYPQGQDPVASKVEIIAQHARQDGDDCVDYKQQFESSLL